MGHAPLSPLIAAPLIKAASSCNLGMTAMGLRPINHGIAAM